MNLVRTTKRRKGTSLRRIVSFLFVSFSFSFSLSLSITPIQIIFFRLEFPTNFFRTPHSILHRKILKKKERRKTWPNQTSNPRNLYWFKREEKYVSYFSTAVCVHCMCIFRPFLFKSSLGIWYVFLSLNIYFLYEKKIRSDFLANNNNLGPWLLAFWLIITAKKKKDKVFTPSKYNGLIIFNDYYYFSRQKIWESNGDFKQSEKISTPSSVMMMIIIIINGKKEKNLQKMFDKLSKTQMKSK